MKKLYYILALLLVGLGSFAQPKYVYTAIKSGLWSDISVWDITVRTDGVPKDKVVIPAAYIIIADNNVNNMGLGDIQIEVSGAIQMAANTQLNLTANSSIEL